MAHVYSRKALAEYIGSGQDTASAARRFNRSIDFIEHEQQTRDYQYYLDTFIDNRESRTRRTERTAERGLELPLPRPGGKTRRTDGMQPFSTDRMEGRRYGPMIPFNRYNRPRMLPYTGDGMTGKPSGDPMLGRLPRKREGAQDILHFLDGQPDLVRDYMLDLVREAISENNFTDALLAKLNAIENRATADQTAPEVIALLNMLPRGSRLNINWFDGELNIPTNTVQWHGQFQLNTAYESGYMVIDAGNIFIYIQDIPATNTVRPASDTRAEHLDAGSPQDLINATKSGLTFTFVRRSGDNINLTFDGADLVTAAEGMTTGQKTSFRSAIQAAAASHNHDDRYYTETEINNLLAGKSNVGHTHDDRYYTEAESNSRFLQRTTSALVSLINTFSEAQEDTVRNKLEATHDVSAAQTFTFVSTITRNENIRITERQLHTNAYRFGKVVFGTVTPQHRVQRISTTRQAFGTVRYDLTPSFRYTYSLHSTILNRGSITMDSIGRVSLSSGRISSGLVNGTITFIGILQ